MTRRFHTFFVCLACVTAMVLTPSCHHEAGHNRYREAKTKPSQQQLREDAAVLKRNKKSYHKQMRSNRKHLFGRAVAPKD